jgi:PIG-P
MSIMGLLCISEVRLLLVRELFVLVLIAAVLYIGWAFLPSKVLHFIGVYYYPDRYETRRMGDEANVSRWWAVAIPSLATITLIYVFAALQGYNRAITPSLDRLECVTGIFATSSFSDPRFICSNHNGTTEGYKARHKRCPRLTRWCCL